MNPAARRGAAVLGEHQFAATSDFADLVLVDLLGSLLSVLLASRYGPHDSGGGSRHTVD